MIRKINPFIFLALDFENGDMKINDIYNSWNYEPSKSVRGESTQLLRRSEMEERRNLSQSEPNRIEINEALIEDSLEKNLTNDYREHLNG